MGSLSLFLPPWPLPPISLSLSLSLSLPASRRACLESSCQGRLYRRMRSAARRYLSLSLSLSLSSCFPFSSDGMRGGWMVQYWHWGAGLARSILSISCFHEFCAVSRLFRDVKKYSCMFEISCLSAARQLGQPMHSQSANFGKFKLNSRNLGGIILHDSVLKYRFARSYLIDVHFISTCTRTGYRVTRQVTRQVDY